jgi:hypothetical protein
MKRFLLMVLLAVMLVAVVPAQWQVVNHEDMMTGTKMVGVYLRADATEGALNSAVMLIRFTGDVTSIFINWGGYSMALKEGRIRYGSGDPVALPTLDISLDDEAVFLRHPDALIAKWRMMKPGDTFIIGHYRASGPMSVAKWTVGDLDATLKSIGK